MSRKERWRCCSSLPLSTSLHTCEICYSSAYVSALKENIDLRFQNTLPLLGALSIFDPTLIPSSVSELQSYGVDSIKVLAKHYFPDQQDRLLAEWNTLKYHMKEMTLPADVKEGKGHHASRVVHVPVDETEVFFHFSSSSSYANC